MGDLRPKASRCRELAHVSTTTMMLSRGPVPGPWTMTPSSLQLYPARWARSPPRPSCKAAGYEPEKHWHQRGHAFGGGVVATVACVVLDALVGEPTSFSLLLALATLEFGSFSRNGLSARRGEGGEPGDSSKSCGFL